MGVPGAAQAIPGVALGTAGARAPLTANHAVAAAEATPEAIEADPAGGLEGSHALVPAAHIAEGEDQPAFGPVVARLPVELDVAVPVRGFRVHDLLALAPGAVIESQWNHGSDLPLAAGNVQLAWTEFEVVETKLAVRVTRPA